VSFWVPHSSGPYSIYEGKQYVVVNYPGKPDIREAIVIYPKSQTKTGRSKGHRYRGTKFKRLFGVSVWSGPG